MILGKKETKQGNGLRFCKVVYIEKAMQKVIPNIHVQAPYYVAVHKRATVISII